MNIKIIKKIQNIKFPKIINFNNIYYIFGIDQYKIKNKLNKFILKCYKYDYNLKFIKEIKINYNFKKSTLIWQIIEKDNFFTFIIEQKSINNIKQSCTVSKYFIKKENLEKFIISKIENIPIVNHLISKLYKNYIFSSKIEIDEGRPNYYWGKYLFLFYKDNISYRPEFDKIIDYSKDKGHLLHYLEKINDEYIIIFSIRHKIKNKNEYYYNLYSAKSLDLINFYNTKEIKVKNNLSSSKWYCYPEIFKKNNEYFILLNQDDFGKIKKTLIGKLYFN